MKKKAVWIVLIVAVLAVVLAGVFLLGNQGNIQELKIIAKPFVTVYEQGEAFDPAGLIVEATDKDGLCFTLQEGQYSLQIPEMNTPGVYTVTVKCGGKKAEFTITVIEKLAVTALELDVSYINYYFIHNEEYSMEKSGLIVYAVLADGSRRIVNDYDVTPVDTSVPGKKQVTVSYGGLTASYEIEVVYGVHFVPVDPQYNEKEYLYLDWNTDAWTPANSTVYHRSADGNKQSDSKNIGGYFVYYIDYGAKLENLILLVQTRMQSRIWSVYESQNLNFECGFSLVPGAKEGDVSNMLIGAAYMAVPTYSNNQEVAFDLIRRMIQEDIQSNIGKAGLRPPILKSVITSDAYKQEHPELYTFANNMLDGSVRGLPAFTRNQMELWDAVGDAFNSVVTTDNDITAILTTAQSEMEKANQ